MSEIKAARAPQLSVQAVSLQIGAQRLLNRIDLDLGSTGCTVILGPNGAGKSLFLKALHGLVRPSSGGIFWGELLPEAHRAHQSLVFQKPVLLRRSVAGNIDFILRARGLPPERRDAILHQVNLLHKAAQPARRLSGGEMQRLALARALVTEPEVLLLDEPTASLDPSSVLAIERIVSDAREKGMRILFVTHDVGQARRMADDIVFLHEGRALEHASVSDFFPAPESAEAALFLRGDIIPSRNRKED